MYVPYTYMYIRYKCNNNIFLLSDNIKRKTQKKKLYTKLHKRVRNWYILWNNVRIRNIVYVKQKVIGLNDT